MFFEGKRVKCWGCGQEDLAENQGRIEKVWVLRQNKLPEVCESWDFDWFHKTPSCLYGDCIGCGQPLRSGASHYRGYRNFKGLDNALSAERLEEVEWRSVSADQLEAPIAPRFQHQFYCTQCYRQAAAREKSTNLITVGVSGMEEEAEARRKHRSATLAWAAFCALLGLCLYYLFAPKPVPLPIASVSPAKVETPLPAIPPPGADRALEEYYRLLSSHNYQAAYDMRSSRARQIGLNDGKTFADFKGKWSSNIGVSVETKKVVSMDATSVDIAVKLRSTDRISVSQPQSKEPVYTRMRVHMVYENGRWRYDGGTDKVGE